jgi:hypothetical protein
MARSVTGMLLMASLALASTCPYTSHNTPSLNGDELLGNWLTPDEISLSLKVFQIT